MSLSAYVFIRKIMKSVFKLHFSAQWEDHRYSFVWLSYCGFGRSRRRELLGTTPCWASSVGAQRDGTCICCWAPARLQNGACSAPAAIDRCLLPAGRSAANPPVGQTDARPALPCFAYCAGSVNTYSGYLFQTGQLSCVIVYQRI